MVGGVCKRGSRAYDKVEERERERQVARPLHALSERHAVAARLLPVELRGQQL